MKENFYKIIRTVPSPLYFFAIVILLVVGMILYLAAYSKLPAEMTQNIIHISLGMFVLLIIIVTVLVIFYPKSYEKNSSFKNYTKLYDEIKTAGTWWHHLENTWMIRTNKDATYWYNKLCKHLGEDDRILIIEVKPHYQGWLKNDAWEWLRNQFRLEGYSYL